MRVLSVGLLAAALAAPAAAEICNKPVLGQFATTTTCASTALGADAKPLAADQAFAQQGEGLPWLFERPRPGNAPVITVKLDKPPAIRTLHIENGWSKDDAKAPDRFKEFGRAREVLLETSAGVKRKVTLRDTPDVQDVKLPRAAKLAWIRLTVISTHDPAKPVAVIRNFYANMEEYGLR